MVRFRFDKLGLTYVGVRVVELGFGYDKVRLVP